MVRFARVLRAFAGTEAIESALYLGGGKLVDLSPQAFSDCVPNPEHCGGTGGCEGATYDLLFSYANSTHGAVLESDYKSGNARYLIFGLCDHSGRVVADLS